MFLSGKESNLNLNMFKYINILWRSSFSSLLCLLFGCVCFPLQASLFYFSPSFLQTPLCCFHRGVVVLKNLKNSKFTSLCVKAHPGKKRKKEKEKTGCDERGESARAVPRVVSLAVKKKIKKYISESRGVFFQPRVDFWHLKSCCVKRKEEEKKKKKALESKFVTQRPESPPRLRSMTPNPFSVQYLDPFSVSSSPACAAPCPL